MTLNDKAYLPNIVQNIRNAATAEREEKARIAAEDEARRQADAAEQEARRNAAEAAKEERRNRIARADNRHSHPAGPARSLLLLRSTESLLSEGQ